MKTFILVWAIKGLWSENSISAGTLRLEAKAAFSDCVKVGRAMAANAERIDNSVKFSFDCVEVSR